MLTFSCVDGPGNRLVIFLQGCNYQCLSCHNPYTINHCNHCGDCLDTCPSHALTKNEHNTVEWNESLCTHCDRCIDVCSHQSSPKVQRYTLTEMLALIEQHAPFLSGITVSGGEATLQLGFIRELFLAVKNTASLTHLTCFIDSNGSLSTSGWDKILPVLDGAMIDLKAWQQETHQWLVGRSNHRVFTTIDYLAKHHKLHEVRLLHIPTQSDLLSEIDALSALINTLPNETQIRLNAFRHHGVVGDAALWPQCSKSEIDDFQQHLVKRTQRDIHIPNDVAFR